MGKQNRLTAKQKQTRRNDFEKFFDAQIATLRVNKQIVEAFRSQKGAVVQKASGMTIGEGNTPFLPVIKPVHLGYYGLMAMVCGRKGAGYINPELVVITDRVETPDGFYYIYDVEDGAATLDKSPRDAEKIFRKQSRFSLTAAEVINLCILRDVLSKRSLWATGSRCEFFDEEVEVHFCDPGNSPLSKRVYCKNMVPAVFLYDNRPLLNGSWLNGTTGHWGSPSCGSR